MMTQASALDHNNFQEWNSDLLANSLGNIHLSGVLVLPPGQKVRQEVPPSLLGKQQSSLPLPRVQSAQKQHQSKQEVPKAAHSFFNKKDTSSLPSSSKPSNVSSRPPLGSKKTIEKPSATTAVKTSVSNPLVASEDELGSSQDESLQAKKEQIPEDVDEDEWEEGGFNTGEKYVLDKEKLKKRDEIQSINSHFLDDESSEDEDVETKGNGQKKESKAKRKGKKRVSDLEELSDSDNFTEKKTKKSKKKQSVEADVPTPKIQIHGAMDDFFEDIVRKQGSDGNILKKKKTKLVEKVPSVFSFLIQMRYLLMRKGI